MRAPRDYVESGERLDPGDHPIDWEEAYYRQRSGSVMAFYIGAIGGILSGMAGCYLYGLFG